MSLKLRDWIAWLLLILSAAGWSIGYELVAIDSAWSGTATTVTNVQMEITGSSGSADVNQSYEEVTVEASTEPPPQGKQGQHPYQNMRRPGILLSAAGILLCMMGVFVFWQKNPFVGPDGAAVLIAAVLLGLNWLPSSMLFPTELFYIALVAAFAMREVWGWIRARLSLGWSLCLRLANRFSSPAYFSLFLTGWVLLTVTGVFLESHYPIAGFLLFAGCFGILCLIRFGKDLNTFMQTLQKFQAGETISPGMGILGDAETKLAVIQKQHAQAVRTAVTSERFKVELISNVSHDLRTPLTSILGYGELLEKENLSEQGREQLNRLNRKAAYMHELVDALFELTKVSSGVLVSKKEKIDLIRLLEQTVGLFDDQLVESGLTVRRSYDADSVPVISDGAMLHQVFANLLGNAIKYALTGTRIFLEVRKEETCVSVRMVNTASYEMDFKPEEILQRFARGDQARSTQGSGLGLAIAQTYTESCGGRFRISIDGDQFNAVVILPLP